MTDFDRYVQSRRTESPRKSRLRYGGWILLIILFTLITIALLASVK